jgi:hypothetical protein
MSCNNKPDLEKNWEGVDDQNKAVMNSTSDPEHRYCLISIQRKGLRNKLPSVAAASNRFR